MSVIEFPVIPAGAKNVMQLIDKLRAAERPVTIPGINPFRGATEDDCTHTAFELERITTLYLASVRALLVNLNESLSREIKVASFLQDTANGMMDLVSDVRAAGDRQ